ncbi:glucokinase [Polymorphobacter sp.]|uniref:glucokinase n=1 Tax=Polymorphobacter sp. TaxID=1909290 RepID=UPI003F713DC5
MEIVAIDLGGTHARFAIAEVVDTRVVALHAQTTLKTGAHASLESAWTAFADRCDRPLPRDVGIAVAGWVSGDRLNLTNIPWVVRPSAIPSSLGVDRYTLINDFGAVGHAIGQLAPSDFRHVCGPDRALPESGIISVIGPGTGLGVAHVLRSGGRGLVSETEGGHIDFAPLDVIDDAILARLRPRYRRVSAERIVSGPGLANIHEALAAIEGRAIADIDQITLWKAAMAGTDRLAAAALDRFCMSFGATAGDIALAQGAAAVVIAGGLGARLVDHLPDSGFAERFVAKGRFEAMMAAIPVKLIVYPEPGLLGAAAAFIEQHMHQI